MRKEQTNNAHQTSGVILAVRMLTFDSRLDLKSPSGKEIQILLGAGVIEIEVSLMRVHVMCAIVVYWD
ncbi:hypothetical protein P8452_41620 [Trifolium repens]|nr:putative S-adenosyl-L-methionine-dependent methyltransferase [Trifolium repens]WJX55903.1 hypothetical protein P8452_41620 [Trifolium repens]